ncbi:hypothetical protein [Helicobacter typhlonius]|uniref:hypothetical protein n=3 Tax=Helicobacter typhlonius TaxID=76936 RepID=UPI002FDF702D
MKHYKIQSFLMIILPLIICPILYIFLHFGKMTYMNIEYPTYKDVQNKTLSSHNADILIIGDSRAKAGFIPQDNTQINLAIGGTTPIVGYYTLKRYLSHNKAPKIIILSYVSLHYSHIGTFWERAIKFDFLDIDDFKEVARNAKTLNECKTLEKCEILDFFAYKININNFNAEIFNAFNELIKGRSRYKVNLKTMQNLEQNGGHFFYGKNLGTSSHNWKVSHKDFMPNPLISLYLYKIAELAKANNIQIFHYQMPFNQSSFNHLNEKFMNDYNAFLNTMQDTYHIISLNKIWALPDSDFGDADHLYQGSPKTTKDILDKIKIYNETL